VTAVKAQRDLLVIVPAFNEEESLPGVLKELASEVPRADVLVVNDGSADGTSRVARAAGVMVADLPVNLGIGGAMQTGYLFAKRAGYRVAVQVDADGQHDPRQLEKLLAPLEAGEASLVVGSRRLAGPGYRFPRLRRLGAVLLAWIIQRLTGLPVSDTTSGFRAADRRVIEAYARFYPADYPEVEALVYLHRQGLRIREVPVLMRERQGGRSSITFSRAAYYMVKVPIASVIGALRGKEVS
jgi:glycosyltransferase involved in cell wall biosynthesis